MTQVNRLLPATENVYCACKIKTTCLWAFN